VEKIVMTDNAKQDYQRHEEFIQLLDSQVFLSGQDLAKRARISRSAVWKEVCLLRRYGYQIESLHGVGYRLKKRDAAEATTTTTTTATHTNAIATASTAHIVPWELTKILHTSFIGKSRIIYRDRIDSTQNTAIRLAEKHQDVHGAIVISEEQTSGRGRMKRKWLSPRGGIWISVIFKPQTLPTTNVTMFPFMVAVALCDAVRQATKLPAMLKWPNDVMVNGKKVAGILLDISTEAELIKYAIVGIGINANVDTSKFKIDRKDRPSITSLNKELGGNINRLELTKLLLENLERFYQVMLEPATGPQKIIREWRQRTDIFGKRVSVIQQQQQQNSTDDSEKKSKAIEGTVEDINDDGSLLLRTSSGSKNIVFGDVLVRC
jgi:BirA family biotin operon repressor/biotin-[acetyl-CoA-carboxylase] ligase